MLQSFIILQLQQGRCLTEAFLCKIEPHSILGEQYNLLHLKEIINSIVVCPRSPCLKLCVFWLLRYLKSNVSRGGVSKLNDQKDHVTQHVRNVTPDALHSSLEQAVHHQDCALLFNGHVEPNLIGTVSLKRNQNICS